MKWTIEEGLALVRKHQQAAFERGYNLSLGGGVLNTGESEHDLDIVCAPANGQASTTRDTYANFIAWLRSINGPSRDNKQGVATPASGGWWNHTMRKYAFSDEHGRKIDWFVVYDATTMQF